MMWACKWGNNWFQILSSGVWNDVVATIVDGKIQIETQLEEVTQVAIVFNGYINSGVKHAKVGTPVYVYDERNLPLAVSAGVAIKNIMNHNPGPPPIPFPMMIQHGLKS